MGLLLPVHLLVCRIATTTFWPELHQGVLKPATGTEENALMLTGKSNACKAPSYFRKDLPERHHIPVADPAIARAYSRLLRPVAPTERELGSKSRLKQGN